MGSGFLEQLPTVVGANIGAGLGSGGGRSTLREALRRVRRCGPGIWSRADIDGVFKAFRALPEETGTGNLMHVRQDGLGLIAFKTDDRRQRYGYGEYSELRLVQIVSSDTADPGFRRALEICAERLGDPDLVGGPNTFALWRSDADTIELKCLRGSESRLQVTLRPTQPYEREPRDESEDLWWCAVSDAQHSAPVAAGRVSSPGSVAGNWAQLHTMLCAVFGSLAADVPLLHPYASEIAWSIGAWGEPGFLVRGHFSPDECGVETMTTGGPRQHRLPPGRPHGLEAAKLTVDALAATRLAPRDLHYNARPTQPPHHLVDTDFGLRKAPAAPDLDRSQWRGRPKMVHAYIQSETTYDWIDGELHEVSHTDFDPPKRAT